MIFNTLHNYYLGSYPPIKQFLLWCFPDSPPRGPADGEAADCSMTPDSSTVCVSSIYVPHPHLGDGGDTYPSQAPRSSPDTHSHPTAAITSTSVRHPPPAPHFPAQSPAPRSKPSSPSPSCPASSPSACPSAVPTHGSSLGQRRKGVTRKVWRSQRQRGRQSCFQAARDGDRRSEEEKEEERMDQDAEQQREDVMEASVETTGRRQ